mmetsp:Transcript_67027/g.179365  ORF Transcript_67027/g.179365 Transcript_67027/m.179365 type:complete len:221 (-) Transcript_67027:148-810(-)
MAPLPIIAVSSTVWATFSPALALAFALALRAPPEGPSGVPAELLLAEGHGQPAAVVAPPIGSATVLALPLGIGLVALALLGPEAAVVLLPLAHVDLLPRLAVDLLQEVAALAPPRDVVVVSEVVPPLVASLAAPKLPALADPRVPVDSYRPVVEGRLVEQVDRLSGLLVGRELHKAEATGRLLVLVEAHDDALDLPTLPEELIYLLLAREERQVADVQGA